jgi:DNA topoisomerase-1
MAKNLVIVESPAKAKTVGRYLGKGYTVRASVGHVRDLLKSQLSVDIENNFEPKYRVPNEKRPVVKEIQALAKSHAEIYLATDPDREGEAISWHLREVIDGHNTGVPYRRVVFHEITDEAINEAFQRWTEDYNFNHSNKALDRECAAGIYVASLRRLTEEELEFHPRP